MTGPGLIEEVGQIIVDVAQGIQKRADEREAVRKDEEAKSKAAIERMQGTPPAAT